jgi:hypothetical protein
MRYESAELAKSLNMSETEAEKMRQQAIENELNRKNQIRTASIGAQDRDQLMNRARALMAVDKTLTLEEAMQRADLAAGAVCAKPEIHIPNTRENVKIFFILMFL